MEAMRWAYQPSLEIPSYRKNPWTVLTNGSEGRGRVKEREERVPEISQENITLAQSKIGSQEY